ncbi:phosphomannomutase [Rhizobium aquaticum]|uniref:Phosphomannomutase n=1 Tax=Rhizobium aquaticum TaxID=1549636 RepID=A0ABV2J0S5_9HYPH
MSLKFGTSGLRGLSEDLKGEPSFVYAKAFALYLFNSGLAQPGDKLLIGRDFRESSPEVAANCIGALQQAGLQPIDCGTVPTPALAHYGLKLKAASLMITGSHIPADRNGIKFYRPDGEIGKSDETAIAAAAELVRADRGALKFLPGEGADGSAEATDLFLARNKALLKVGSLTGLRIGVYQHSTVARDMLVDVLGSYGADVVPLGRSETFIPVDTEAVSPESIRLMQAWAREHGLDAIVSADGDGDRPLVADETGLPLRGDLLGLITALFLGADTVVTPVTSNSGIEAAGDYRVVRTRVGSPFVIAGMEEARGAGAAAIVGFEANGGTLTGSDFQVNGAAFAALPTRDCFLPILAVLSRAAEDKVSLSALSKTFALPVAAADRLENFATERSAALMAYLRGSAGNLARFLKPIGEAAHTSDIDGLRVTLKDGRVIHFRPSGNAPEMRCYVEAKTEEDAAKLLEAGLAEIRNFKA